MLIEFFRHGARLPYIPYKLSKPPIIDDSDLTAIGMRQEYLLGLAIRQKYTFLNPTYTYTNVEVYSSNRRRTLVSAMSQLQGLFDLGTGMKIDNDDPEYYNPPIPDFDIPFPEDPKKFALPNGPTFIPVQSPEDHQNYLFTPQSDCPSFKPKVSKFKAELVNKYNSTFTHTYEQLLKNNYFPQEYSKDQYFSIPSAYMACDSLISYYYNEPKAEIDPKLVDECKYLSSWFVFGPSENREIQLTSTSEVSSLMKRYLTQKQEGKLPDLQLLLLSAHDISMAPFLKIFFPDNFNCVLEEYKKKFVNGEDIKDS